MSDKGGQLLVYSSGSLLLRHLFQQHICIVNVNDGFQIYSVRQRPFINILWTLKMLFTHIMNIKVLKHTVNIRTSKYILNLRDDFQAVFKCKRESGKRSTLISEILAKLMEYTRDLLFQKMENSCFVLLQNWIKPILTGRIFPSLFYRKIEFHH